MIELLKRLMPYREGRLNKDCPVCRGVRTRIENRDLNFHYCFACGDSGPLATKGNPHD